MQRTAARVRKGRKPPVRGAATGAAPRWTALPSQPSTQTMLTRDTTRRTLADVHRYSYRNVVQVARLDVRLGDEQRRRLEELVEAKSMPISDVVRGLIDDAYENVVRERRRQAVERLIGLEVEDPPDAATLSRELEAAHEPGGFH